MANTIQYNCKTYKKTISGATVSYMEDYMKSSLQNPPDQFILHGGTNDLFSENSSMEIAESIINLTCRIKNEIHDVNVSKIISKTNGKKSNEKGMEVNLQLTELFTKMKKKIFVLIDN